MRLQNQQGLYRESGTAVTFLTPTVFRAAIPMPAAVSTGTYAIDVQLFSGGILVARTNSALEVIKTGFEQYVADAARDYGLLYGMATALMALDDRVVGQRRISRGTSRGLVRQAALCAERIETTFTQQMRGEFERAEKMAKAASRTLRPPVNAPKAGITMRVLSAAKHRRLTARPRWEIRATGCR